MERMWIKFRIWYVRRKMTKILVRKLKKSSIDKTELKRHIEGMGGNVEHWLKEIMHNKIEK